MELYTLDDQLRRIDVVDLWESLIWTERWRANGDFQLVLQSTPGYRELLKKDTQVVINESDRVMTCETIENKGGVLTISGRSLESTLLENRVAMDGMQGLTANPNWVLTGTPGAIARSIFKQICIDGLLSANDKIPFIQSGNLYPAGNLAEPSTSITTTVEIKSVYAAIKELCDVYDLGFRLVRNLDTSKLYFEIYSGSDRTSRQSTLVPVVFSPDFDNLTNVSELTSTVPYKNVAYVFAPNGSTVVYATGVDPSVSGFDRRVMFIKADDITLPAGAALTAELTKKGSEALAVQQVSMGLDGEISQLSSYKYGTHYFLGDLVEMRNSDGVSNNMRVTEQIFVSDHEGERSYPTLELDVFITPGSWLGWNANEHWAEVTDVWANK
jgi:hypothetical protein